MPKRKRIITIEKESLEMSRPLRICFLADRHNLYDDRIYWKMAVPLVKEGFSVHYVLIGNESRTGQTKEGVHFRMFKLNTFSKNRILNYALKRLNPNSNYKKMFKEAKQIEADIYHFHDLWINRIGVKLKQLPHKPVVFYDAREPYAEDYTSYVKTSFPFLLQTFANGVDKWEKNKAKHYDLVIANEATVQHNFAKVIGEDKSIVLYNYWNFTEKIKSSAFTDKKYDFIYTGAITALRGCTEILKAVSLVKIKYPSVRVLLIGNFYPNSYKQELESFIKENDLQDQVELKDAVPYDEIASFYNASKIGLVLLQRVKTFEISMPIKIFEYMAFGLPVIGSDFGHMKNYIEKDHCGIAVQPDNTIAIADAMIHLLKDHEQCKVYGENGRKATREKYNWDLEFKKLLDHYNRAVNANT